MNKKLNLLILFLCLFLMSCASRPQLYPNSTLKSRGQVAAKKDTDSCIADAEIYLKSSKGKQITKSAGAGAVIGGVMGAVSGVFTGNVVRGATQGAAIGGAGGAASGAISPDQLRQRYVNHCLAKKGYEVIGWD